MIEKCLVVADQVACHVRTDYVIARHIIETRYGMSNGSSNVIIPVLLAIIPFLLP